jgi:hypothetical protein
MNKTDDESVAEEETIIYKNDFTPYETLQLWKALGL